MPLKMPGTFFLSHNMNSTTGIISSSYLKALYGLQRGWPLKPVRYLTKKHFYPSNLEKMNVLRAVQIFSPTVTSALKLLKEEKYKDFVDSDATILYMENMFHFFQVHNISSRRHYIHALDSNVAPYVNISDQRLHWLNTTFQNYIDDIQSTSASTGYKCLSSETAHALKFIAKSTFLCVQFLLTQAGFYYVLTRSFSSDAVEATFSHIRLKGGSNDTTDARAAEYALRQILRTGILKSSSSANTARTLSHISRNELSHQRSTVAEFAEEDVEELFLPTDLRFKIHSLQRNEIPEMNLYSASVAFLSGYIIMKLQKKSMS